MACPQPVGDRAGADEPHAVEDPRLAAEVGLGQVGAAPVALLEPRDGDRAVGIVERGQQPDQREQRVRRGAAELAAVQRAR